MASFKIETTYPKINHWKNVSYNKWEYFIQISTTPVVESVSVSVLKILIFLVFGNLAKKVTFWRIYFRDFHQIYKIITLVWNELILRKIKQTVICRQKKEKKAAMRALT